MLILNGHRSANRAGFRDVSSELQKVRMRHNSVRNIDSEVVGRIACASLRHENEVPGPIVRGAGLRDRDGNDKTGRDCCVSEKIFIILLLASALRQ